MNDCPWWNQKSKGHVAWVKVDLTEYELFVSANGDLWKAPRYNAFDPETGNRMGHFEGPAWQTEYRLKEYWGIDR